MTVWWGTFDVKHGQQRRWRIGPAALWVQRLEHEWTVAWETAEGPDDCVEVAEAATGSLLERASCARFGVADAGQTVGVAPALADRPVVARPVKPFSVPAGQTVTVFVGSPLWVIVAARGGAGRLLDQPLVRPSDTWFGPNTQTGELCYAARTACRLRLDDLPLLPHRAATAVTICNRASAPLALERLKLPVEHLGLHRSDSGTLWTEAVELTHLDEAELAPLAIADAPPSFANARERVATPRKRVEGNVVVRAFSSLFA